MCDIRLGPPDDNFGPGRVFETAHGRSCYTTSSVGDCMMGRSVKQEQCRCDGTVAQHVLPANMATSLISPDKLCEAWAWKVGFSIPALRRSNLGVC